MTTNPPNDRPEFDPVGDPRFPKEKGAKQAKRAHDAMVEALKQCREYFDNLADADCDQDGFIPNKEMRLLSEIDAALKLAEGQP